jgi:ribosome-associated protein
MPGDSVPGDWQPPSRPGDSQPPAREVAIRGDTIRLGQLLKLAGVVDSGSDVKALLASEPVWVNGERETRRGRQLRGGDTVRVGGNELRVLATPAHPQT